MIELVRDLAYRMRKAGYSAEADYLHLEADAARSWEAAIKDGCNISAGQEYAEYLREFAEIFEAATAGDLRKVAEVIAKEKEALNA